VRPRHPVRQSKGATRLAEALWLSFAFQPPLYAGSQRPAEPHEHASAYEWQAEVLGSWVSPYDVVANGSRHIFAVDRGVRLVPVSRRTRNYQPAVDAQDTRLHSGGLAGVWVDSLDAPIASFTDIMHLISYDGDGQAPRPRANQSTSVHFNCHNNLWGTAVSSFARLPAEHSRHGALFQRISCSDVSFAAPALTHFPLRCFHVPSSHSFRSGVPHQPRSASALCFRLGVNPSSALVQRALAAARHSCSKSRAPMGTAWASRAARFLW